MGFKRDIKGHWIVAQNTDGRVTTAINAISNYHNHASQDVTNGNGDVILHLDSVQVKIEWALSKVHKYGTLRVDPHRGVQFTLHNIFANVDKLISQKLSIICKEDSPCIIF